MQSPAPGKEEPLARGRAGAWLPEEKVCWKGPWGSGGSKINVRQCELGIKGANSILYQQEHGQAIKQTD